LILLVESSTCGLITILVLNPALTVIPSINGRGKSAGCCNEILKVLSGLQEESKLLIGMTENVNLSKKMMVWNSLKLIVIKLAYLSVSGAKQRTCVGVYHGITHNLEMLQKSAIFMEIVAGMNYSWMV
jgi:hypothetical protein